MVSSWLAWPVIQRLIVSRIILDTFNTLKMHYPETDENRRQELLSIREQLTKQGADGN